MTIKEHRTDLSTAVHRRTLELLKELNWDVEAAKTKLLNEIDYLEKRKFEGYTISKQKLKSLKTGYKYLLERDFTRKPIENDKSE